MGRGPAKSLKPLRQPWLKFRRHGRGEDHPFTAGRMGESQPSRVEHKPAAGCLAADAGVGFIAEQRMSKVFHVNTDLVRASGVQRTLHECIGAGDVENIVVGDGMFPGGRREHGHADPVIGVAPIDRWSVPMQFCSCWEMRACSILNGAIPS